MSSRSDVAALDSEAKVNVGNRITRWVCDGVFRDNRLCLCAGSGDVEVDDGSPTDTDPSKVLSSSH
jgi:hypothetical protein